MNDKMIIIWVAVIIGCSMLLGKMLELIPKIIKKAIEIGVPLLLIINLVRNAFWVKDLMPKFKLMVNEKSVQGILHRIVFYTYTAVTMLMDYIQELINSI